MNSGSNSWTRLAALAGVALLPSTLLAQINQPGAGQGAPAPIPTATPTPPALQPGQPAADAPIVPETEFQAALPPLSGDPNAPLEPMVDFETPAAPAPTQPGATVGSTLPSTPGVTAEQTPTPADRATLEQPLAPLATFDATPPPEVAGVDDEKAVEIRYDVAIEGLKELEVEGRFKGLSALEEGDGKAANTAQIRARATEDEQLVVRLLQSLGYYDATATATIETPRVTPAPATAAGEGTTPAAAPAQRAQPVKVTLTAVPGQLYSLGSIAIQAQQTVPEGLVQKELPLKVGDPIDAERIQAAEANVSLRLPQQGYAFAKVGQRDILLDEVTAKGDYTLPVDTGPRGSFGNIVTEGDPVFAVDHIEVLRRYKPGELYDNRLVDDLREALVATSLFQSVSVEPQQTGRPGPDGTEQVDLLVRQNKGPFRTLAGQAGYGTGQGLTVEGSWRHRNLFPPEGALIVSGIAGTQQQGAGVEFRRSNAGRRDRTFSLLANANRSDYEAFEAFTGTLAARISYDSTPIWQKRFTYSYGVELVGTNEDFFDFDLNERRRATFFIAALPGEAQWDTSDSLLNPTRGFRIKAKVSPEAAVKGGFRPYARTLLEGSAYFPVSDSLVIAGRARAGAIFGIERDDLPPSRRYYAGGGGSVRGFGYQELGPRTIEVNPDFDPTDPEEEDSPTITRPVGGRSLNEFALEARYRFGNFGIVPFIDAGQVYDSTFPKGSDLRFGAGIGGRYYTNFGPLRVDVATPIGRKPGESLIALYISIGQAF